MSMYDCSVIEVLGADRHHLNRTGCVRRPIVSSRTSSSRTRIMVPGERVNGPTCVIFAGGRKSFLLLLLTASAVLAQNTTTYVIHNHCPATVNLYIAGNLEGQLLWGDIATRKLGVNAGFFYTDANGGSKNGSATKAGFYGQAGYYYIVKDVDHFNVGLSISPRGQASRMGFCALDECDSANCTNAFTFPPVRFSPPGQQAPQPPLYECPNFANITWDITFCPTGVFPGQPQQWEIHPGFDHDDKCLDVRGDSLQNGTPVQIYDCNGSPAQRWNIVRGTTKVQLAGTNFCLDAGTTPASGTGLKIWQCFANLPAQQWWYTDDNRIAVEGKGQCLDLTGGVLDNGHQAQTWACTANNANQVWTLSGVRAPPRPPQVRQVHPDGNGAKCLDVRAAVFANGTPVQIYDCNGSRAQNWEFSKGSTKVQLSGTNFCLDAGSSPANGIGMKIWQCFANLPAQQWWYTDDNRLALENQGMCLDLMGGLLTNGNPVQTWQCTANNNNQVWTV